MKDLPKKADKVIQAQENITSKKDILDAMFKAAFGDTKIRIVLSNKSDLDSPPVFKDTAVKI